MVATETPVCDFGWKAPDFSLPGIDGRTYNLESIRGPKGTLVMFICNHCPYVQAIAEPLTEDCRILMDAGIGVVAINANDADTYPEDSFDRMKDFATEHGFPFPYVIDESQAVARAYDAVCTPDFFGFDKDLGLQYRGRFDASGPNRNAPESRRELREAMLQVAETGQGPREQTPSIGCSIKWRAAA